MARVLQSQIPTLPLLYQANKLSVVDQSLALYTASSAINARIGIIRTDITGIELENGAIVNAANSSLLGGGGVDGAIHRAAGPGLLAECRTLGGALTGQSKITDAYALPCKKVIHTVGPIYHLEEKPHEFLRSCYQTSLELAVKTGLSAIVFAAVSTGIYGYPSYHAARVALDTVRRFMETEDGAKLELVVFCNFEKKDEAAYSELTSLYFPPPVEESQAVDASMRDAGDSQPVDTTMKQEEDGEDEEDEEEDGDPQPDVRATEAEVAAKTTEGESEKAAGVGTGEPTVATEEPRKVEKSAHIAEPADEDWVKL